MATGWTRRPDARPRAARPLRLLGRLALALVAAPVLWGAAALGLPLVPGPVADVPADGPPREAALILTAIHADFAFPLDDALRARLAGWTDPGTLAAAAWVGIGWGARDFYTTAGTYADLRPGAVWRAVTGDRAVLRIELYGPIDTGHPAVRRLVLPERRRDALLDAALGAAALDADGRPVRHPFAGFTDTDVFFEARGRFDAFRTCNVWVGRTLREAGVPFGLWTPTPLSVSLALGQSA